ncbi:MAG: glycosyltransferase family 4 protein [bacterium]
MKTCLISNEYHGHGNFGGVGSYTFNMAKALRLAGYKVTVIAKGSKNQSDTIDEPGIKAIFIPDTDEHLPKGIVERLKRRFTPLGIKRHLWTRAVLERLDKIVKEEDIRLVEVSEFSLDALSISLPENANLILRQHSPWDTTRDKSKKINAFDNFLQQRREKTLAHSANLITCPSQKLADFIEKKWSISPYKIVIYPNPVDTDLFKPCDDINVMENSIVYAGRIEHIKGVESLVRSIASVKKSIPQVHLRIINADSTPADRLSSYEKRVLNQVREYGLEENVEIISRLKQPDLVREYCSASIAVVPSLWESLPYAVLEPMACGCAVIASRCGGIPEIIQDQINGLLAEPLNVNSFTGKILRLLRNPSLVKELGHNARERIIKRFSLSVVSREVDIVFRELCI